MILNKKFLISNSIFILMLLTYASGNYLTYIGWGTSLVALFSAVIVSIATFRVSKDVTKALLMKNIFLFWSLLGLGYWVDIGDGIRFTLIAMFYSMVSMFILKSYDKYDLKSFCKSMFHASVFWGGINTVFLLLFILGFIGYENNDFSGIFENRNQFAIVSVFLMSFIYLLMLKDGFQAKYMSIFVLMILLILVTKSMKGFLSIGLFIFIMNVGRLSFKKIFFILLLSLTFSLIFLTDNPISYRLNLFIDGFSNSDQLSISSSAYLRFWLLDNGITIALQNPFFGVGVNQSIHYLIPEWYQLWFDQGKMDQLIGMYSHNNFVEMALNGGFLCLVLYYLPFVLVILKLPKRVIDKNERNFFYAIVSIRLFTDWGSVSYYDFINIFWVMLLLYFVLLRQKNAEYNY